MRVKNCRLFTLLCSSSLLAEPEKVNWSAFCPLGDFGAFFVGSFFHENLNGNSPVLKNFHKTSVPNLSL